LRFAQRRREAAKGSPAKRGIAAGKKFSLWQINKAVKQMNSITRQVAADAGESASSAESLNAQPQQTNGCVIELTCLAEGIEVH
jgi:hypothetical protein